MATDDQGATPNVDIQTLPSNPENAPLIGLLAGEPSGDLLGASLIKQIKAVYPNARFIGIGGPEMISAGLDSLHNMERLSVMGFVDPLKRLPELLRIRKSTVKYLQRHRPDVFIGIDSPDFNLGIEKQLKHQGIKTIHYVSPSVWAWRQGRVKKIRAAVDHVLCLLPFEAEFFEQHQVGASFIGHPMADEIPLDISKSDAKKRLGIDSRRRCIALLPGSRMGEVRLHTALFLGAVERLMSSSSDDHIDVVIPAASNEIYEYIQSAAEKADITPRIFLGQSREVLAAADFALMASGTATLECMLMKTPMVVAYKLENFTYSIAKRLVKTEHIALPNLLADRRMVEEFIQDDATEEVLCDAMSRLHSNEVLRDQLRSEFRELHVSIRRGASQTAAQVVLEHVESSVCANNS